MGKHTRNQHRQEKDRIRNASSTQYDSDNRQYRVNFLVNNQKYNEMRQHNISPFRTCPKYKGLPINRVTSIIQSASRSKNNQPRGNNPTSSFNGA